MAPMAAPAAAPRAACLTPASPACAYPLVAKGTDAAQVDQAAAEMFALLARFGDAQRGEPTL